MKKSLAVRTVAVVMVLVSVFFLVLPDMVKAEGEGSEPVAEVMEEPVDPSLPEPPAAEEPTEPPVAEEPVEEPAEPPVAAEPVEEPAEPPIAEEPTGGLPAEPSGEQQTESTVAETQPTEVESAEPATVELPEETATASEATEEESSEPTEEVKDIVIVDTDTVSVLGGTREEAEGDLKNGFLIEGNTITGYKGAGGHIVIPDGITTIADNAFYGNTSITAVTFSGSVQTIGSSAFNGCSGIAELTIPASVTAIGVSAFANCTGLASVNLTSSTGTVTEGQFYNCLSLTSVTVPEGISSIASAAFGGCANLTSVSLPTSLASIDLNAFAGDANLAAISVATGNGSYASYDGCLYNAGGSQLLMCPPGKTAVAFAPSTTAIAGGAFTGCNFIPAITIPMSVDSVAADAFAGSALQNVTIPAEVTAIGSQSAWSPRVIYGYRDTVAESWAEENHYLFESLNGTQKGEERGDSDDNEDENGEDDTGTHGGNSSNSGNTISGNSAGATISQQGGANTSTVRAAAPTTSGAQEMHIKDVTPKTGVEDYGRNFLLGAVLLLGVAFFAYSKKLENEGL